MPKRITLVTSMILFTAITGQAYARPQHFGTQHSTHAMASQANTQDEEFMPGADNSSAAAMHRYTGGPKSND